MKSGNYCAFQANMETNEHLYLDQGVYLVLEQIQVLCLARLVMQVFLVWDKQTRINVLDIACALQISGYQFTPPLKEPLQEFVINDDTLDKTECLLANLISQGLMKGYLLQETNVGFIGCELILQLCRVGRKKWH